MGMNGDSVVAFGSEHVSRARLWEKRPVGSCHRIGDVGGKGQQTAMTQQPSGKWIVIFVGRHYRSCQSAPEEARAGPIT